jgi:predicted nucleotide-binding protein
MRDFTRGQSVGGHNKIENSSNVNVGSFSGRVSNITGQSTEPDESSTDAREKDTEPAAADRIGTNIFVGHGRSAMWRELKDFVQDRLSLPWDEFNRVPVAGVTNVARLSEMLDAAAIALLVLTAEDEMADGAAQARMNVVHEAGLFQGRLGFTRAIVLLEEGCADFSNIQGLGHIRFPRGNIAASFEEVRRVLEREGLLGEAAS